MTSDYWIIEHFCPHKDIIVVGNIYKRNNLHIFDVACDDQAVVMLSR